MRLFVAIPLPDTVIQSLAGLRQEMQGVCWVPPEHLHLTLCFLGNVEGELLDALCRRLTAITMPSIPLAFTRIGCFPHPDAPRVLWMGVQKSGALERLALQVKEAVRSCGISIEKRPFTPHVTLARIKPPPTNDVRHFLECPVFPGISAVQVYELVLFQSILSRDGAQHTVLKSFPLAGPT